MPEFDLAALQSAEYVVMSADAELTDERILTAGAGIAIVDGGAGGAVTISATGGASAAWPVGSVFIAVVATDPNTLLGFGTWAAFATGRVLVGIDPGDPDFDTIEEEGGAKTHTLTIGEMPSHTHVQDAHNHTQNAHTHTQNSHNHTQNAHGHTIAAHNHDSFSASRYTQQTVGAGNFTFDSGGTFLAIKTGTGGAGSTSSDTAINQAATATNQNTTAVNQATTAVNQSTGGGGAHNNVQPYIVVHMWKRTA